MAISDNDNCSDPETCLSLAELEACLVNCRACPRLVAWREEVAATRRRAFREETYWGRPVPGFGDPHARLLVVGLAPGAHGSNRTGRMFTGDASGDFLYPALFRAGFASQPTSRRVGDGLELKDVFITAVGRCAPPDNKPTPHELNTCQPYLQAELRLLTQMQGVVALGRIAFERLSRLWGINRLEFVHARLHRLPGRLPWVITSYHPSRQNTQTGRLTEVMFDEVWQTARSLLE
ncbi:uracil-DNA glycosylase [Ornatilinea apprima]|uniref:Type-5 uracil-DNA glycosylase n=1 Tax=Ornatilinea apprima TaxID=1134406 RepID=A0A0P6XV96_9CHLR|nr:uracil-DNA glycosylase [Ornatilinea apprima]KPL79159.1 uracil-DNA glycosylase [Ornatilinea apprima]